MGFVAFIAALIMVIRPIEFCFIPMGGGEASDPNLYMYVPTEL